LIDELEGAIGGRDIGSRAEILRRVTDLFVAGAAQLTDEQVVLFDSVMARLVEEVESSARAALGRRLADLPGAPPQTLRTLALDDSIEVAGAVLTRAESLDDATLVEGARTKSQEHLLAISYRRSISEAVTDALVERGNREVVVSTARNAGARFSDNGYSMLVKRSASDAGLALSVWLRPDISREHMLRLFAAASDVVQAELIGADRRKAGAVQEMVARASEELQAEAREWSPGHAAARDEVRRLHESGELTEARLCAFAEGGQFDHAVIALSLLSALPIGAVERAIVHERTDQLLLIAKAIDLSWQTTKALLLAGGGTGARSTQQLAQCLGQYSKLQVETARKVIQFYRLRDRAALADLQ
jgi:uncharacterized protein (DUF2336 family)